MSFEEFLLANEKIIRMSFFFGMLVVIALWELAAPKRALTISKTVRWINNLGLVFFNSFILRVLFPAAAVGVAVLPANKAGAYLTIIVIYLSGLWWWLRSLLWIL